MQWWRTRTWKRVASPNNCLIFLFSSMHYLILSVLNQCAQFPLPRPRTLIRSWNQWLDLLGEYSNSVQRGIFAWSKTNVNVMHWNTSEQKLCAEGREFCKRKQDSTCSSYQQTIVNAYGGERDWILHKAYHERLFVAIFVINCEFKIV